MKPYVYFMSCRESTAAVINAMSTAAVKISHETFARYCDWFDAPDLQHYEKDKRRGLTLKDDFMVSFYKSTYCGVRCYYVSYSAIDLVWVPREELERLKKEAPRAKTVQSVFTGWLSTGSLDGPERTELSEKQRPTATRESGGSYSGWAEPL